MKYADLIDELVKREHATAQENDLLLVARDQVQGGYRVDAMPLADDHRNTVVGPGVWELGHAASIGADGQHLNAILVTEHLQDGSLDVAILAIAAEEKPDPVESVEDNAIGTDFSLFDPGVFGNLQDGFSVDFLDPQESAGSALGGLEELADAS